MTAARVGCSGWHYAHWRHAVYDGAPPRAWFARYAATFDTVELNSTFYRLPSERTVETWAAQAPPGFLYAVKLGAFGTHRMKLRDPARWLDVHVGRVAALGATLGPTLVQLPPRWRRDAARLDDFLAAVRARRPHDRWAVELREPSWVHDDVLDLLARHRVALCVHDLLPGLPRVRTTDWSYVRLHGPDATVRPYAGEYGEAGLRPWTDLLGAWSAEGTAVFAYCNNDDAGAAFRDAGRLRAMLVHPTVTS